MKNSEKFNPVRAQKSTVKLSMIGTSLKNFVKNISLVFVPMGVFYLFLVVAMLLFASSTLQNVSGTISGFVKLLGESVDNSSASVKQFFEYAFEQIDWNGNFFSIVRQIVDTGWITKTFSGFFATLSASSEGFDAQVATLVNSFTSTLKADISVLATLTVLGVVCANLLMRFLLRRRAAKRNLRTFILSHTLVPLVQSLMPIVAGILMWLLKWYALLPYLALVALWAVVSIINSWLIYRDGTVRLKDVLTVGNVFSQLVVCVIMLVIVVVVFTALWFVNPIISILVTIPVFIYAVSVIDVNTDSYVCTYIRRFSAGDLTTEAIPAVVGDDTSVEAQIALPCDDEAVAANADSKSDEQSKDKAATQKPESKPNASKVTTENSAAPMDKSRQQMANKPTEKKPAVKQGTGKNSASTPAASASKSKTVASEKSDKKSS